MKIRHLLAATLAMGAMGSANAALSCADSTSDAGSVIGSTDLVLCAANPNLAGNGTFYLESLDANLSWGLITLSVTNASDSALGSPPMSASIDGVSGSLYATVDNDAANDDGSAGFTYRFSFQGLALAADASHDVVVGGFPSANGADSGSLQIFATAVPEADTYAMMLAGLGALGFMARRRKSVK